MSLSNKLQDLLLSALGSPEARNELVTAVETGSDSLSNILEGSNISLSLVNGQLTISATGGGGSPGGSNTQIQFNDSGSFGGDSNYTWNKGTQQLQINGVIVDNFNNPFIDVPNRAITFGGGGTYISNGQIFTNLNLLSIQSTNRLLVGNDGSTTMMDWSNTGFVDFGANILSDIADPVDPTDAASKKYVDKIKVFTSNTSASTTATQTITVTGLQSTDTILSVSQSVVGTNNLPLLAYGSPGSGSMSFTWSANPGTGARLKVLVKQA